MEKYFIYEMTRPEIEAALASGVKTAVVGEQYMQAKTDLLVAYIRAQRAAHEPS